MIVVIPTEVSNIRSVVDAFKRLGENPVISDNAQQIKNADHVVLPGVGHAQALHRSLKQRDLLQVLPRLTQPVLGICLGMQFFYDSSAEGETKGLGVLEGRVTQIVSDQILPHMGWNELITKAPHPIFQGVESGQRVYFVHTFAAPMNAHVLGSTLYGTELPALVANRNFYGMQFHPERSGKVGHILLRNFLRL